MIEVIIILCLLILNGLFAMCEIALVSSKKGRLVQAANSGSKGAKIALELLAEPEKFLSTVQVGITLVGIIAGAYGGERFTKDLAPHLKKIDLIAPIAEQLSFGLIVALITYFSLIIGELVPKTIALNDPEKITIKLAPFMKVLSFITYPFVIFLSISTKLFLKVLFIKENKNPPVTEEELKYMIDTGSQTGIIEKRERDILHAVLRSEDKKAIEIMTKKKAIMWIDINQRKEQIMTQVVHSGVTKFPVCNGVLDKLIGVGSISAILKYTSGEETNLRDLLNEPVFFPENMTALKILEEFKKGNTHMGFVVNEHGAIKGLVTLQDIIEDIVGEIPEMEDLCEDDIVLRPDGTYLVDGSVTIGKLTTMIEGLNNLKENMTLAEFVKNQLQTETRTGSNFKYGNYTYEIIDMDGLKIDKVLVIKR